MPTGLPRELLDAARQFKHLLDEHDALMDQAEGFGVKTAAVPKRLMPLREAQRIVVELTKSVAEMSSFVSGFYGMRIPPGFEKETKALRAKADEALAKFQADLKEARVALEKHEDLLVGENFQAMFEALRHAVLDLDLTDDVDVDFDTDLQMDADPPYAVGTVAIQKGPTTVYKVHLGYKAEGDHSWGNIWSAKKNKVFQKVVSREGFRGTPSFVRDLVGQVKALADSEGVQVFKSRQRTELRLSDPAQINAELRPRLTQWFNTALSRFNVAAISLTVEAHPNGSTAMGTLSVRVPATPGLVLESFVEAFREKVKQMTDMLDTSTTITTASGQWDVKASSHRQVWGVHHQFYRRPVYAGSATELTTHIVREAPESAASPKMDALRARAVALRVDISDLGSKRTQVAERLRRSGNGFMNLNVTVDFTLDIKKLQSSKKARRVAFRYLHAGSQFFVDYADGADVDRAFREAQREAEDEYGHQQGYSGQINMSSGYRVVSKIPMTMAEARRKANAGDSRCDDKRGPCCAVPISEERVLGTPEKVTVTVEARDEKDAIRQGTLRIKATGRIPPKAKVQVEVKPQDVKKSSEGGRKQSYTVTGTRKLVIVGEIKGWLFYGWAPS